MSLPDWMCHAERQSARPAGRDAGGIRVDMKTTIIVVGFFVMAGAMFGADDLRNREPIADASDATKRAVSWANKEVRKFRVKPFTDKTTVATFDGKQWVWRGRVGQGTGDLEVSVYLDPQGGRPRTSVKRLLSAVESKF